MLTLSRQHWRAITRPVFEHPFLQTEVNVMSYNLANKSLAERAEIEDEKSRLFELWQSNLGKAKGEAARLDAMSPPEFANMVRAEVNRLVAAARG
jgi:hypothetical protein